MEIRHIEGIHKLSQNKPRLERERVIAGLKADGAHGVASLMQGHLDRI
jgi:predicted FMN-binding regulatory protein PaiB